MIGQKRLPMISMDDKGTKFNYQTYSTDFVLDDASLSLQLDIGCGFALSDTQIAIDDFSITKTCGVVDPNENSHPNGPEVAACASNLVDSPGFEVYPQGDRPWRGTNYGIQVQDPMSNEYGRRAHWGDWLGYAQQYIFPRHLSSNIT